jgi:hypothetical protein
LSSPPARRRFAKGAPWSGNGKAVREEVWITMATYVITHDVDDVAHWLSSPRREEVFGPMGITIRTFRDPEGSKKVALIAEIPDMEAFQEVMRSQDAADAMEYDGVHPETLLVLSEG